MSHPQTFIFSYQEYSDANIDPQAFKNDLIRAHDDGSWRATESYFSQISKKILKFQKQFSLSISDEFSESQILETSNFLEQEFPSVFQEQQSSSINKNEWQPESIINDINFNTLMDSFQNVDHYQIPILVEQNLNLQLSQINDVQDQFFNQSSDFFESVFHLLKSGQNSFEQFSEEQQNESQYYMPGHSFGKKQKAIINLMKHFPAQTNEPKEKKNNDISQEDDNTWRFKQQILDTSKELNEVIKNSNREHTDIQINNLSQINGLDYQNQIENKNSVVIRNTQDLRSCNRMNQNIFDVNSQSSQNIEQKQQCPQSLFVFKDIEQRNQLLISVTQFGTNQYKNKELIKAYNTLEKKQGTLFVPKTQTKTDGDSFYRAIMMSFLTQTFICSNNPAFLYTLYDQIDSTSVQKLISRSKEFPQVSEETLKKQFLLRFDQLIQEKNKTASSSRDMVTLIINVMSEDKYFDASCILISRNLSLQAFYLICDDPEYSSNFGKDEKLDIEREFLEGDKEPSELAKVAIAQAFNMTIQHQNIYNDVRIKKINLEQYSSDPIKIDNNRQVYSSLVINHQLHYSPVFKFSENQQD